MHLLRHAAYTGELVKFTKGLAIVSFVLGGAATWQAAVTGASAQGELRAYVLLDQKVNFDISRGRLTATFTIRNFGETAAYAVRHAARVELLPFPVTDSSLFDAFPVDIEAGIWEEQIAILPHMSFWGRTVRAYDNSDQAMIPLPQEGWRWHVFGQIQYEDIFGETRNTSFCYSVRFDKHYDISVDCSPVNNKAD